MSDECPVCNARMNEYADYIDYPGTLCEHGLTCPNGCYSFEFAYGYTTIHVSIRGHHLQFGWGYSDDRQTVKAETDAADTACHAAQRAQLEDTALKHERL